MKYVKTLLLSAFSLVLMVMSNSYNDDFIELYASNVDYCAMSIDEKNNVEYIKYEDFHKFDDVSIINEMYDPNLNNKGLETYNDPISTTSIFGGDDRTQVSYSQYTTFPFSAVCVVRGYFDTNGDGTADIVYNGSGAIVGPNTVLTSSYLVYHPTYGWKTKTEVIPARHTNSNGEIVNPYGIITNVTKATVGGYHNTQSANDAWAIIDLGVDIGSETGYFGTSSTDINLGSTVKLIGYHSDINMQMAYGNGNVTYLETYKFYHNCDATSGTIGAPLLFGMNMVGIHFGGVDANNDVACKISSYIVGWIHERLNS